ncbi:g8593 [Coccomyxa elongata]
MGEMLSRGKHEQSKAEQVQNAAVTERSAKNSCTPNGATTFHRSNTVGASSHAPSIDSGDSAVSLSGLCVEEERADGTALEEAPASASSASTGISSPDSTVLSAGGRTQPMIASSVDPSASQEQVSARTNGSGRTNTCPKEATASADAANTGSTSAAPEQASAFGGRTKAGAAAAQPEQASAAGDAAKSGSTSAAPVQASASSAAARSAGGSSRAGRNGASRGSAKSAGISAPTEPKTSSSSAAPSAAASDQQHVGAAARDTAESGAQLEKGTAVTGTAPPNSSFTQYLWAELNPNTAAPPSGLRQGRLERQRVYNAILFVPFQLERLLWYGLLVCLDSFLAVFTVLPVRLLGAVSSAVGSLRGAGWTMHGDQLFDVLCVAMFGATIAFLRFLPAGTIYFWLKDLTQEFLKLHVVHGAVEIFDKISCAFVVDALEALSGTCGLYLSTSGRRWHLVQLGADMAVTLALVLFHSVVLICQFMTFSVAMNSKRSNAIIALLIASNFVEIKGTVFKRFDPSKLFVLVGQDVTERFHLLLSLLFVVVEEMDNSGSARPNPELLRRCAYIFGAEIVIDITKHAVLSKLNDIHPSVYQRFMRDVCEKAKGGQSHTAHRVVAFEPYAPAALFLRIAVTALVVSRSEHVQVSRAGPWRAASLGASCAAAWLAVFLAKAALGFSLRGVAKNFLMRHPKAS